MDEEEAVINLKWCKKLVWATVFLAQLGGVSHSISLAADAERSWTEAQKPIVEVAKNFATAFNKHDVGQLKGFFVEDARLVTVDGVVLQGRDAILELLNAGIAGNPGIKQAGDIRSIRLIGDSVAIEQGFIQTTTDADKKPNVVAYNMVYVKRDGQWKIFDVMETAPVAQPIGAEYAQELTALDVLVGEWIEESEFATVHHKVKWSPNHRYLLIEYVAETQSGKTVTISNQRVGWDPKSRTIRSWLFEEDGGHGTATWTETEPGKSWLIKSEAVLADGQSVSATLRLSLEGDRRIKIAGYDRTADGKALPDAPARTLIGLSPKPTSGKNRTDTGL